MGEVKKLYNRHLNFMNNVNVHIALAVEEVEPELVAMNKKQMSISKDSNSNPLIHKQTGSEFLSLPYQKKTKKKKPDLLLSGNFQRAMFLNVNENNLQFFIDSEDVKAGILTENYGNDTFGISEKDQPKAKILTGNEFEKRYNRIVRKK